jgi:integrase
MRIIFRSAYGAAIRNKLCDYNPAILLEIPVASEKVIRALTQEEESAVIEEAKKDCLGHIAIFMLDTGLRSCEVTNLKWSDYSAPKNVIFIRESKTKSGIRTVPLIQEASDIIENQPHYCEYVFTSSRKNPITKTVLRRLYNRLRKETGISTITNHVYRHSFATRMVEKKADYKALSTILGHSNVAFTIFQYTDAETKFLHEQIALLEPNPKRKLMRIKDMHVKR